MARVTVEDCLDRLGNQFELTAVASKRARQLARGANAHLEWEDDKTTVMALREIADGHVGLDVLDEVDLPPIPTGQERPQPPAEELAEEEDDDSVKAKAAKKAEDDAA